MKKFLALALAFVMIMGLSLTAFAVESPVADQKVTVVSVLKNGATPKSQTVTVTAGKDQKLTFTAEAKDEQGAAFAGWMIYKKDGSDAVQGKDYLLVSVSGAYAEKTGAEVAYRVAGAVVLKDTTLVIVPLTDLIVTANYGTVTTDIKAAQALFTETAAPSGDTVTACLALVLFVALAGVCVSKKQLAK